MGRLPDGRVVFVPFTAPGDLARVRLVRTRARFAHAELLELVERGPGRTEPACEAFGRCGGCAWQHLDYATQLEAKQRILHDALERIAGIGWRAPIRIEPSPEAYAYRGRTRVAAEGGRVGYRMRGSRELCEVKRCPVLVPELEAELAALSARALADGEWELVRAGSGVGLARVGAPASPLVELEVAGECIRLSPGVFLQSNALLLDRLVRRAVEQMGRGDVALELHAGAGCFTLGLARRFRRVRAVESNPAATADLRENLEVAGLGNTDVRTASAEREAAGFVGLAPDAVLVDPPRAGLERATAEALAAASPARLVYLSCDPATLARDLRLLLAGGLVLREIEAFDLFPQTPHVEALALLTPAGADAGR